MNITARTAIGLALALSVPGLASAADTRSGRDIYEQFRAGLAEPGSCATQADRWTRQYAHAPQKLAKQGDNTLALFGHVVDALRAAHLPTEYALIPFVESGYNPAARSPAGPTGLWQMIGTTARNHKVPMRAGYDGRLSPIDSTRAAVRYLKTLHGMFGGNWRLAAMAYNVGEYRVFGAIKRSGQSIRTARADQLAGLPDITRVYDDKLHSISCVIARADRQPQWLAALDRPVRRLAPVASSETMVASEKQRTGPKAPVAAIAALLPSVAAPGSAAGLLGAPTSPAASVAPAPAPPTSVANAATAVVTATAPRRHTVAVGESLWRIARLYRVPVGELVARNGLKAGKLLAPGMVLAIDAGLARK